jgi:hypothetical protein
MYVISTVVPDGHCGPLTLVDGRMVVLLFHCRQSPISIGCEMKNIHGLHSSAIFSTSARCPMRSKIQ